MPYVVVVYSGPRCDRGPFGSPRVLYSMDQEFVTNDRTHAERAARDASREHGARRGNTSRYAVHETLSFVRDCSDIPPASLLSSPVYVPPGSEDCAAHFINANVAPTEPTMDGWFADLADMELRTLATLRPRQVGRSIFDVSGYGAYLFDDIMRDAPVASPVIPAAVMASTKPLPLAETKAVAGETTFEIRAGLTGTDRETWGTVAEGFTSGKEAAAWVSERKAEYASAGKSLHIVKREAPAVAIDWRARERERFESGAYVPLPGQWADMVAKAYPDHFAHVATSDKRKVAFTETEASGERDKQKVLSATEYANRYFDSYERGYGFMNGGPRYWGGDTRNDFIAEMVGASTNVLFAPLGDPDAIDRVYADCSKSTHEGVSSCMTGAARAYANHERPIRVYALGGDITIAFLRAYASTEGEDGSSNYGLADPDATWDGDGAIITRCLVWPEAKQYGRVYGDSTACRTLRSALEAQGYTSGDLEGARIGKVPLTGHGEDAYQMPYLDIGGGEFSHSPCGDYFIAGGEDGFGGVATNGVAYAHEKETCERCESTFTEDVMRDVAVSEDEMQRWCSGCCGWHTGYVDHAGLEAYVPSESIASYVPAGSSTWRSRPIAVWQLEANGGSLPGIEIDSHWHADGFTCEDCGSVFAGDEMSPTDSVCYSCDAEREESSNTSDDDTAIAA